MNTRKLKTNELIESIAGASTGALVVNPTNPENECYAELIHPASGIAISMYWYGNRERPEFSLACLDYVDESGNQKRLSANDALHYGEAMTRPTTNPEKAPKMIVAQILRWLDSDTTQAIAARMREYKAAREDYATSLNSTRARIAKALGAESKNHDRSSFTLYSAESGRQNSFKCFRDDVSVELRLSVDESEKLIAWMKAEKML